MLSCKSGMFFRQEVELGLGIGLARLSNTTFPGCKYHAVFAAQQTNICLVFVYPYQL